MASHKITLCLSFGLVMASLLYASVRLHPLTYGLIVGAILLGGLALCKYHPTVVQAWFGPFKLEVF